MQSSTAQPPSSHNRRSYLREGGASSSFNRALASTDELDSAVVVDSTTSYDQHISPRSSLSQLADDNSNYRGHRRQSSSSVQSSVGSNSGKTRRPSNSSHHTSSRSKILASSASSIEKSNSSSSAYEYRIRSSSRDQQLAIDASSGPTPPSPNSINARMPSSPMSANRSNQSNQSNQSSQSNGSVSSIISMMGTPSLAERKRRLTSASTSSNYSTTTVEANQRPNIARSSNSSLLLPLEGQSANSKDEMRDDKSNTPKQSLRSRLFGLRRASKDTGEGQVETSDANSIASAAFSTDYRKEGNSSPAQTRLAPLKMPIETKVNGSAPLSNKDLLSPASAAAVRPQLVTKLSEDSKETHNSWITSLSNVSPPAMPEYEALRLSPVSMGRGNSGEESPASPGPKMMTLQRNISWPASADRKGSFVSTQGSGSGKGYRFENAAASQTRISPTPGMASSTLETPGNALQVTNSSAEPPTNTAPSFLSFDPSPTIESPPPVERREKSRSMASKLASPPSQDIDLPDTGRRMRNHIRSDSSTSNRSMQSSRTSLARPRTNESGNRRIHYRSSSAVSMSWQDGQMDTAMDKHAKRRSATAISTTSTQSTSPLAIAYSPQSRPPYTDANSQPPLASSHGSNYGSPPSPVLHMPRSSSLHGRNTAHMMSRTSSTTNTSFISAGTPTKVLDEFMEEDDQSGYVKQDVPLNANGAATGVTAANGASEGATSAISNELGLGEKEELSQGDFAHMSSVDTMSEGVSRDSDVDRTLLDEASRQASRKSGQLLPGEEPKRPRKNPLRKVSSTKIDTSSRATTPNVPPSPVNSRPGIERRVPPSPSHTRNGSKRINDVGEESLARSLDQSPPRHSLEDVAHLRALADNHFHAMSEIMALPLVPQSAKRLVDVTGSHEKLDYLPSVSNQDKNEKHQSISSEDQVEYPLTNASMTSFTTEDDQGDFNTPNSRTQSLTKAKTPVLANAFSRTGGGSTPGSRITSMMESTAEDDGHDTTSSLTIHKKKSKKWPFTNKDSPNEAVEAERRVPSIGSKMANSLRGRKSEPQTSRPMIRRVYDEPRLEEGQDESIRVTSSDTTVLHSPTVASSAAFRTDFVESTQSPFPSLDSGPTTPILTSEEMTPEVKKLVHRRNVIRELVETEKSYSSDLAVVRDIYLARLKSAVGLSTVSSLQTPLSGHGTPTSTPTSLSQLGNKASPLYNAHRKIQRMASSELKTSSPAVKQSTQSTDSPSSLASSSEPSNRSSTYTVSSQTSQASDTSFPFNASNAPPMPATPPNLASLSSANSGNTLHAPSPSSMTSASTHFAAKNLSGKPKMQVSTTSLPLHGTAPVHTPSDVGFTVTDLRVMFSHLEACCAFAEDMSSDLAGCMGTFARSKRLDAADVTVDMDKEDDRLGETFLQHMPKIRSIYIEYCSRHEASMLRLQEVIAASPKASSIFKECTESARKHTNAWDLASLLIKPVQRVLKYPLLIQQIVNSTAKSHPDYLQLSLAFDEIQAVADEINQVKRRKDLAETLITGKVKEAKGNTAASSTLKGRKKPELMPSEDGLLTPFGGEAAAMEEYDSLLKQFQVSAENVAKFASQCTAWTHALRETYESQLKVMRAIRRTYRLQVEVVGTDGVTRAKEGKETATAEERLTAKYIKFLQNLLAEPCRQADRNVRLILLPLIIRIADMFDSPQSVVNKRDERQADYQRYRQNLLAGRQSERRTLENANGFIALNAQLVEELPLFLQGVQTLLEVGVRTFAKFQTRHFDEIRTQTLTFWKDVAKKPEEIMVDEAGVLKMRSINPVRVFWQRHSAMTAWVDSLAIVRREDRVVAEEGETGSAASTPGLPSSSRMASASHLPEGGERGLELPTPTPVLNRTGSSNSATNNDHPTTTANTSYFHSTTSPRRPTMVGGLIRTISGTFSKDADGEVVPPLPSDAASRHMSASTISSKFSTAPMLPNLAFKDKEGESGYFVQSGPIAFLDTKEKERTKRPYDSSPSDVSKSLTEHENASRTSLLTRNSSNFSSISVQGIGSKQVLPDEHDGDAPRRQRMNVLYVSIALLDSRPEVQDRGHLGWPYIAFVKGDTLRVLSSSDSASTPLLFGRIDRTGELGWAEKWCF